jgi:hypothetical protein
MEGKKRHIEIDFMYLDMSVCTRCQGTDTSLDKALSEVVRILEIAGVDVVLRKTHIQSEQQAQELGFVSSPTILINGRDIQEDLKESLCKSCADLIGGEPCECRVWTYEGKEYGAPPSALIIDAILREVYGGSKPVCCPQKPVHIPENIKRFLAAKKGL